MKRRFNGVDVRKAAVFAMVINALQIVMMGVILCLLFFGQRETLSMKGVRVLVALSAVVVGTGAAFDIRDAINTRELMNQVDSMEHTLANLAELNNKLRAQRHDFLNHLQVVYSLIEMREYDEANAYIERIYGEITALSRTMKTASPAINALLQVKLAACEKAGITVDLHINSNWKDLPIPGWEMCKVLSNLIDNAIDALADSEEKLLTITMTEDLHTYRFEVADSGAAIPPQNRESIFEPGVTTKSEGHGMGLYIVRKTLREHGGDIQALDRVDGAAFEGWIPKVIAVSDQAAGAA